MAECSLFIDCDGTPHGTHVVVIGEDGTCLGELKCVQKVDYSLSVKSRPQVTLTLLKVPGRYLASEALVKTIKVSRWRRRFKRWWNIRWRLLWIAL